MKFLFVVQGEGRGHLTQAIALKKMLVKNGHEVVAVLVGKSNRRELPAFFFDTIEAPVYRFESPNFLPAAHNKKANLWISIIYNLLKTPQYLRSIRFIHYKIKQLDADMVVNFYEMMTGLTYALFPPQIPYISVAHQYLFLHPAYKFPDENKVELLMLKFFTRITCMRSSKLFALAIEQKETVPGSRIAVVPPLLRKEVLECKPENGNFLHGYLLNANYAGEIIAYQKEHPDVQMHFFWDKKNVPAETAVNERLTFYKLDDKLFIQYMAKCKGYATTAGFESVCEAMYLGKPVLMVPTHIEQSCNAHEASLAGAGVVSDHFDIDSLLDYIPVYKGNTDFHAWAQQSEMYWMKEFDQIATFKSALRLRKNNNSRRK
ncbi:glycosyl transferase [Bacteroidia bacterium]|nr:glycosyl transferase [Bacteroidia bacterium]